MKITITRTALVAGVAALPLTVLPAQADSLDPYHEPTGLTVFVEGRYLWLSGARQPWTFNDDTQQFSAQRVQHALSGAIGARYRFSSNWDAGVAYTGAHSRTKRDSRSGTDCALEPLIGQNADCYDNGAFKIKQSLDVADFDVGYRMMLGSRVRVRATAGVRFVYWQQDAEAVHTPYDLNGEKKESNFWGIGPRVGVEAMTTLFRAGPGHFTLQGSIAGSVLFGRARTQIDSLYDDFIATSETTRKTKAVPTAEASLGIGYVFPIGNWKATVLVGYRGEGWWRMVETRTAGPPYASGPDTARPIGTRNGNLYQHGPFGRFTIAF
ncbi:MAG: Lpg1974 family pore-forming outer membrane protein [Alphaproteobacteria bacterium]